MVTTTLIVILSLMMHVSAFNTFAIRSTQIPFPTLAGHATVDVNGMMSPQPPERILQTDEIQCPVCGRLGVPLLPLAIPFPNEAPDYTCWIANSNEFYETAYLEEVILPKCALHQDIYEELCCNISEPLPLYQCEENVRSNFLNSSYSPTIVPVVGRKDVVFVDTLVQVYAISEIDLTKSVADIFANIILTWNDPRLAWDVTTDNCATSTFMRASLDAETTDIWVPPLDLQNLNEGVQSFAAAPAQVYSDGTVVWSRGGKLSAFCSFVGLRRMPFDTLGCQFLFGGPIVQPIVYNLVDGGIEKARGVQFPAYNQTYSEYMIAKGRTTSSTYGYGFTFELFFNRARRHYTYLIIVPTILFVYISFGQFFYDSASGERVAFSINALLIVVAQSIVTSGLLPLCQEVIWLNYLTVSCQFFVLAGIFEALLLYCLIKKKPQKEDSAALVTRNDAIPDVDDPDPTKKIQRVQNTIGNTYCYHSVFTKLRYRLLTIMLWVDFAAKFVLPISFTLFLIVMFARLEKWDDDPKEVWNFFEL